MVLILPKVNRVSHHKLHPLSTPELLVEAPAAGKKEATSVAHIFINILSNFPCSYYLHESTKCPNSLGVLPFPICLITPFSLSPLAFHCSHPLRFLYCRMTVPALLGLSSAASLPVPFRSCLPLGLPQIILSSICSEGAD